MTESSGCDPQLAALKHLLVDGEPTPDWFTLNPRIGVEVTQPPTGIIFQRDPGDETNYVDGADDSPEPVSFGGPCDWCTGADVELNADGSCPVCGYDW